MAWRLIGDKPLSEPMLPNSSTHIWVTRGRWMNVKWIPVTSQIYAMRYRWTFILNQSSPLYASLILRLISGLPRVDTYMQIGTDRMLSNDIVAKCAAKISKWWCHPCLMRAGHHTWHNSSKRANDARCGPATPLYWLIWAKYRIRFCLLLPFFLRPLSRHDWLNCYQSWGNVSANIHRCIHAVCLLTSYTNVKQTFDAEQIFANIFLLCVYVIIFIYQCPSITDNDGNLY